MADPGKPALLLLDDDAVVREVLQIRLTAAGYAVSAAASTHDALRHASTLRFDCLLIDQHLGTADGVGALAALRRCDGARDARAIAISADLDQTARDRLAAAGFDACVQKPVAIDHLLAVIEGARSECAAPSAAPSPGDDRILDDAAALALWGSSETVRLLRSMLLPELDVYRTALQQCCALRDRGQLRGVLHRMRSSAAFCGALALTRFIDATVLDDGTDWSRVLTRFDAESARLRPALLAALAT